MELVHQCAKCGEVAPHYPYQKNECKQCVRIRVRANRERRLEYYRQYDRDRGQTDERKAAYAAKQRRKRATTSDYNRAHNAVNRAVANGTLVRPSACTRCGATGKIDGHHDDHSKPLEVMWLCPACHAQRHVEIGKVKRMEA